MILTVKQEMDLALTEYRFNDAAQLGYKFLWNEFCDWYLEIAKVEIQTGNDAQQRGARRRQGHTALGAVEQAHAQQRLQVRNGLRQRRLRHVQAPCRIAEVQRLGHRHKLAPQPQLNGCIVHTPSILMDAEK